MADRPEKNLPSQDELLAAFTDQVLDAHQDELVVPTTDDPDLRALEQTVLRIKKTFGNEMPTMQTAQRIRSRLEKEFRLEQQKVQARSSPQEPDHPGWLSRLIRRSNVQRQRTLALGLAFACIILLASLVVFFPNMESPPAGAAGMVTEWLPLVVVFLVVAVVAVIWLVRAKHR